jgi:hypothetical protein
MLGVGAGTAARRAVAIAITAVVTSVMLVVGARPVAAADGYSLESASRYVVDPVGGSVRVEVTYRMTNTTPDRSLGNGRVEFYFFDGLRVPVDAPADGLVDLVVLLDGEPADVAQVDDDGVAVLDVDFPYRPRYRRTATVTVSYRLLGAGPRTEASFVRVNPAYISFPVHVYADDGAGDVRVEVPADWTTDYVGGDFDQVRRDGDLRVLIAEDIADTTEFGVLFTARLDDELVSTPLTVGGSRFEIRSWPGDGEWLSFAERHIGDGVPALERLVGTPWPEDAETDVIEASTPYLRGYAGYYYADTDVIEVGEDLDAHTILHELSHAWFNDAAVAERWISEGLADEIGARAVADLGGELPGPDEYDDREHPIVDVEPFPLNEWDRFDNALDDTSEYYGYRTSFEVMRALGDELGERRMTELVAALIAGERAYGDEPGGSVEAVLDGDPVDWQEFLDLAEQVGGATGLEATYRELVVADGDLDELDRRDGMIEQYDELAARGGTWAPPEAVRAAMADWQWVTAEDRIAEAYAALDARDGLATVLEPVGLAPADRIEAAYQASTDLIATEEELDTHRLAAERLVDARADVVARLGQAGFDVPPLTQGQYDAGPLAITPDTEIMARLAAEVLDTSRELDDVLAARALSTAALPADAFVGSPAELIGALDEQLDAARTVVSAFDARDDAGSLLERIGAVGSDVDARLVEAADALAAGDHGAAIAAATSASDTLDGFDERGTARLVAVALGLLIGLAGITALRLRRRSLRARAVSPTSCQRTIRRHARQRDTADCPDGSPDLAADRADARQAVTGDPDR